MSGFLIQNPGVRHQGLPVFGWMNIDFDHARIRRDLHLLYPRVARGFVTFNNHRDLIFLSRDFNRIDEVGKIIDPGKRWQKYVKLARPRLDSDRCVDDFP